MFTLFYFENIFRAFSYMTWECGLYSLVREGNQTTDATLFFFLSTVLLSDMMQCNLIIHKISARTKVGVVIDSHCSLYRTHDFSDPERHWLYMTVESKEFVIGTRNIILLGFTVDLRQSRTKLQTRRFPYFCLLSEEFILRHRQSTGFCQHDGPCFTPIQNNILHFRSGLCICFSIN
jgi:hypothetical protein